jgi:hypothetical protein
LFWEGFLCRFEREFGSLRRPFPLTIVNQPTFERSVGRAKSIPDWCNS